MGRWDRKTEAVSPGANHRTRVWVLKLTIACHLRPLLHLVRVGVDRHDLDRWGSGCSLGPLDDSVRVRVAESEVSLFGIHGDLVLLVVPSAVGSLLGSIRSHFRGRDGRMVEVDSDHGLGAWNVSDQFDLGGDKPTYLRLCPIASSLPWQRGTVLGE